MRWVTPILWLTGLLASGAWGQVRISGAGATFPAPIYQRWIAEYSASHPQVQIDYQPRGSGAGIAGILDQTIDFAASDAPMSRDELEQARGQIVEIPAVAGAVAVAYNLPDFEGELKLTGPVLAEIFLGNVTNWNDPQIAACNPQLRLPNLPITPIVRGDKSGTTFVFSSYLATQSQDAKDVIGTDKSANWPQAQRGEKSDGVTLLLKEIKGSIGYIEQNYAARNRLRVALVKNRAGNFVGPTVEAISAAAQSAGKGFRECN